MKKVLSFILLSSFVFAGFSQSIQLYQGGQQLNNNQTITFTSTADVNMIGSPETLIGVKNVSNDVIPIKVKKTIIDTVTGTVNSFCWGQCFDSRVMYSPNPLYIESGETDNSSFYAEFWPNGHTGATSIQYTFFKFEGDIETIIDSASVIITFVINPASVQQFISENSSLSNARPNPASNFTQIPYQIPSSINGNAQIVVKNLLGASVFTENVKPGNGKIYVNTSDFDAGIYFYSLVINNETYFTKKLVIKRE